jgi:hypothetical protein
MKILKRVAGILAILVSGPIVGALIGLIVAGFQLPSDPTGHGAPGEGLLMILYGGFGILFGALASLIAAAVIVVVRWPGKTSQGDSVL